jgi:hypothetical protein
VEEIGAEERRDGKKIWGKNIGKNDYANGSRINGSRRAMNPKAVEKTPSG